MCGVDPCFVVSALLVFIIISVVYAFSKEKNNGRESRTKDKKRAVEKPNTS
jgi:hypothetical protein